MGEYRCGALLKQINDFMENVNVGRGGNDTLFALVDGKVKFERLGKSKKQVSVYPVVAE